MSDIMQVGNKADAYDLNVKSDESSIVIRSGSPVFLQLDGVDDGLAVLSAENLSAHENDLCMGLVLGDILPGGDGKARAFGMVVNARIITATRAATTDPWASYPAGVIGDFLSIVTATGNVQGLIRAGSGSQSSSRGIYFRLASAYASSTTQASSLGTATSLSGQTGNSIILTKVWVRVL